MKTISGGPRKIYLDRIAANELQTDDKQSLTAASMQRIYNQMHKRHFWFIPQKKIRGAFLWGPVGSGKSMLADLLYSSLGSKAAYRGHFHNWMAEIHSQLNKLKNTKNPIRKIAQQWAKRYRIIILDEFLVSDVGDAMIMAKWLDALFKAKVVLVTTANTKPDKLYLNGMQRDRFLPAIALIKQNCEIINLVGQEDYRSIQKTASNCYLIPNNAEAETKLRAMFEQVSLGVNLPEDHIQIRGRPIKVKAHSPAAVWLEFEDLCSIPRSKLDYIEMAQEYSTVLISNLKKIPANRFDLAENLIKAIDIFYDSKTTLAVCAEVEPETLYTEGRNSKAFRRTASRLRSLGVQ